MIKLSLIDLEKKKLFKIVNNVYIFQLCNYLLLWNTSGILLPKISDEFCPMVLDNRYGNSRFA